MEDAAYKFRKEKEPPDSEPTFTHMLPDPSLKPAPRLYNELERKKALVNIITHYSTSGQAPSFVPKKIKSYQWVNVLARQARTNANKSAHKTTTRKRQRYTSDDGLKSDSSVRRKSRSKRSNKTETKNQGLAAKDEMFKHIRKLQRIERSSETEMIHRPSFHKALAQKKSIKKTDSQATSFFSFDSTDDEPIL